MREKQNLNPNPELKDEELDRVSGGRGRDLPRSVPLFDEKTDGEGQGKAPQDPKN